MSSPCPASRSKVVELYFLEHRAKLLDIAAFLDRLDRAPADGAGEVRGDDFRVAALREAIGILLDGRGERTRRILEHFSDDSTEPIPAAPMKGALGAVDRGGRTAS